MMDYFCDTDKTFLVLHPGSLFRNEISFKQQVL